jgi:transposase
MGKINEYCAGIDVGKRFLLCCALTGAAHEEPQSQTQRFDATVPDLVHMRDWLTLKRITHVVMESTGSYWVPIFNILEGHFTILLANPEEVKNRKGHKTDRKDAEHLADLLRHDHIRASYIPPKPVRDLRDLTRRRLQLTQDASRERNRIEKLLEHVNVKIGNVLSDVFGVSGNSMLLALLDGEMGAERIAQLARGQAKHKITQLTEALEGHCMRDHERFLIRSSLRHLACLEEETEEMDGEILRRMQTPQFQEAFLLLQTIPGIGQLAAASILAETGTDLSPFPSAEKMASWAGLCPGNRESAGIRKGSQTTKGNPYLRSALVQSAWAATRKRGSIFQLRFRELAPRRGPKRAIVAIAHRSLLYVEQQCPVSWCRHGATKASTFASRSSSPQMPQTPWLNGGGLWVFRRRTNHRMMFSERPACCRGASPYRKGSSESILASSLAGDVVRR